MQYLSSARGTSGAGRHYTGEWLSPFLEHDGERVLALVEQEAGLGFGLGRDTWLLIGREVRRCEHLETGGYMYLSSARGTSGAGRHNPGERFSPLVEQGGERVLAMMLLVVESSGYDCWLQ